VVRHLLTRDDLLEPSLAQSLRRAAGTPQTAPVKSVLTRGALHLEGSTVRARYSKDSSGVSIRGRTATGVVAMKMLSTLSRRQGKCITRHDNYACEDAAGTTVAG
jgi:hypothetical protein